MTDIALRLAAGGLSFDLAIEGGGLALDDGLTTAAFLSLFTDRRARPDDELPDDSGYRGGWWGDAVPEAGEAVGDDLIGSRLWLLRRSKRTPDTLRRARDYAEEGLAWMVRDGLAASAAVEVESLGEAPAALTLAIGVVITRPNGSNHRFDFVWDAL